MKLYPPLLSKAQNTCIEFSSEINPRASTSTINHLAANETGPVPLKKPKFLALAALQPDSYFFKPKI